MSPVPKTIDMGIYLAIFELAQPLPVQVGKLGSFDFAAGVYLDVGSAQRHLQARLRRHARPSKPRKWHIDYLSGVAPMVGAFVLAHAGKARECELARCLVNRSEQPVSGFGSSDCRCATHLFHRPRVEVVELQRELDAAMAGSITWHRRQDIQGACGHD